MASTSSRADQAPSLPVPPLLPLPQITSSPVQLTKADIVGNKVMDGESEKSTFDTGTGVELHPFGRRCLSALNQFAEIVNSDQDQTSKKDVVCKIFDELLAWMKQQKFSVYKVTPSDIRLFFRILRPRLNQDDAPEIPPSYRVSLLRALRESFVCDQFGAPRSYFHFLSTRSGYLDLPITSQADWEYSKGYTFNIWLCPDQITCSDSAKDNANIDTTSVGGKSDSEKRLSGIQEIDAETMIYSLKTADGNKGVECKLVQYGDKKTTVLAVRSKTAVKKSQSRGPVQGFSSPFQVRSPSPVGPSKHNEWVEVEHEITIPFDGKTWTMLTISHSQSTGSSGGKSNNIRSSFIGTAKKPGTVRCFVNGKLQFDEYLECPYLQSGPIFEIDTKRSPKESPVHAITQKLSKSTEDLTSCTVGKDFAEKLSDLRYILVY